jgi:DNA repair protein RadC
MGRLIKNTFLYDYMAYSKNQPTGQPAECWTACKLSVITQSGFRCGSPVGDSETAHRLVRAVWNNGKLNLPEQMMALFISMANQNVGYHAAYMGTVDRTYGNTRYILTLALHTLACSVILVHNHPSGSLDPSTADITLTKRIRGALELIEVKLVDHLIINERAYLSMSDEGFM